MEELKSVTEIRKYKETLEANTKQLSEEIRKRTNETTAQIRKAEETKNKTGEELEKLNRTLESLEAWKTEAQKTEPISTEEYNRLISEVQKEITARAEDYKKRFLELAEEGYKKGNELLELINQANKALYTLQHDLYQDKDRTRSRNGSILYIIGEDKEVNPDIWRIAEYGRIMAMSYQYKEYTGQQKK